LICLHCRRNHRRDVPHKIEAALPATTSQRRPLAPASTAITIDDRRCASTDTNILLRVSHRKDPDYDFIRSALRPQVIDHDHVSWHIRGFVQPELELFFESR
jgi:hypothetical protein